MSNSAVISLRRIVYGHLKRSGLHGFGIIEIDTWKNLTGEPGRRMVAHSHFLGYPADGGIVRIKRLELDLCQRRALGNSSNARSVVIEPMFHVPLCVAATVPVMVVEVSETGNAVARI